MFIVKPENNLFWVLATSLNSYPNIFDKNNGSIMPSLWQSANCGCQDNSSVKNSH